MATEIETPGETRRRRSGGAAHHRAARTPSTVEVAPGSGPYAVRAETGRDGNGLRRRAGIAHRRADRDHQPRGHHGGEPGDHPGDRRRPQGLSRRSAGRRRDQPDAARRRAGAARSERSGEVLTHAGARHRDPPDLRDRSLGRDGRGGPPGTAAFSPRLPPAGLRGLPAPDRAGVPALPRRCEGTVGVHGPAAGGRAARPRQPARTSAGGGSAPSPAGCGSGSASRRRCWPIRAC